jgi:hypothetical protein
MPRERRLVRLDFEHYRVESGRHWLQQHLLLLSSPTLFAASRAVFATFAPEHRPRPVGTEPEKPDKSVIAHNVYAPEKPNLPGPYQYLMHCSDTLLLGETLACLYKNRL